MATDGGREVRRSTEFRKDAKRLHKRGLDMAPLIAVIEAIRAGTPLQPARRDHALSGDWSGYRECHIRGDWLLIYRVDDEAVYLARSGTHSDLFG